LDWVDALIWRRKRPAGLCRGGLAVRTPTHGASNVTIGAKHSWRRGEARQGEAAQKLPSMAGIRKMRKQSPSVAMASVRSADTLRQDVVGLPWHMLNLPRGKS